MIHLMLGRSNEKAIHDLTEYVHKYEGEDAVDSFMGMLGLLDEYGNLELKTAQRIIEAEDSMFFSAEPDDSVKIQLEQTAFFEKKDQFDFLKDFFSRLYDKNININKRNRENVLNICIHLPLYDETNWQLAKTITDAVVDQNRNIRIDYFFYGPDMAFLFMPEDQRKDLPKLSSGFREIGQRILDEALAIRERVSDSGRFGHIILMQNCNSEGLALNLDWNSFIRILGEFAIASMNSYTSIFNPNAEIENRPIHCFGLCVLNLDKHYYIRYLLSKAYLTILEREGINQDKIDLSIPSHIIQQAMLADNERYRFYDRFFERHAKGNLVDGKTEADINAIVQQDLDGDIMTLVTSLTEFMNDPNLSLPQKRVALAQLLGMDDELATGDMFDPKQLIFRDTYKDCMKMFVSANNALLKGAPERLYVEIPDCEYPKSIYPEELDLKSKAALGDVEIDFDELCDTLKADEVNIRRKTEYIRTLEKELAECEVQTQQVSDKEKVLTKDGFKYGDHTYKLDPIETILLEQTYEPKQGPLLQSVDLRKVFSGIRNQGAIGACTTFSLASIFEFIIKKNQQADADLSERFLYYNARMAAQKRRGEDGPLENVGTSFFDVIGTMGEKGICLEKFCKYSTSMDDINECPSDEAYIDALTRRVVVAKNVNLEEQDIKSALYEGYPVAVSVKLFSNFCDNKNGFVSIPDDDELRNALENEKAGKAYEHNHAMVICGYSDENRVFVVRNSWGTDFGDNGYCYIPYSYITDKFLTNQACIITEVTLFSAVEVQGTTSHEIVQFDKMNPEINAAIIRTLIGEAKHEKNLLVNERATLYGLYAFIEKKLMSADTRESLYNGSMSRLDWEIKEVSGQQDANYESQDKRIDAAFKLIRHSCITHSIALASVLFVWILLKALINRIGESSVFSGVSDFLSNHHLYLYKLFIPIILVILVLIGVQIISYFRNKKSILREHAVVNEELETIKYALINGSGDNAGNLGIYKKALKLRMFLPWLVIRKLSERNRELEQKYQTMVSYTNNLKEWYNTEKGKIGEMNPDSREPFISLVSNNTLDAFYEKHSSSITKDLSLSTLFQSGYSMDDASIVRFHTDLKNKIIAALEEGLRGFTAYRYISGNTKFEFAKKLEGSVHEMLTSLEVKSSVFLRLGASPITHESINATTTILMSNDIMDDMTTWNDQFRKDFTTQVFHVRIESPFKLSFIQMKRVPVCECVDIYEPYSSSKGKSRNK